jgi:cellulose synthase/poly-beta-1,6-N-acetylglucosamine synthase-like glycosyltransferase
MTLSPILLLVAMQLPLLLLSLPVLLLCLQILAAVPRSGKLAAQAITTHRPSIAVVVPAHDEASGIAATLNAIQGQLAAGDRLLVVADNCEDNTAAIARTCGATVIERHDDHRRGKAHALAFGLRCLAPAPPNIVIFIDADCLLEEHALDRLARRCTQAQRPAQALYLMHASDGAPPPRRVAEFAWRVKNGMRALGRQRLGMACQLTGSGMAFPWKLLQTVALENDLVEDLALGLALASQGNAPVFCPQAVVHSRFADNQQGARTQRTRWEHGHLHLLWRHGLHHLAGSLKRRDWRYASLAADLFIPPLSMLLMLTAAASVAPVIAWQISGHAWPWLLPLVMPVFLGGALLAAWLCNGRDLLPPRKLLNAVFYMLGKIPLYLRFITRRQRNWVGAARDIDRR